MFFGSIWDTEGAKLLCNAVISSIHRRLSHKLSRMSESVSKSGQVTQLTSTAAQELTCDEGVSSRLLSPQRDEDGDVPQPLVPEPVHGQPEALAGEHLLVTVAASRTDADTHFSSEAYTKIKQT